MFYILNFLEVEFYHLHIRRLQHNVANQNKVGSVSVGTEPERRIILRRRRQ